MNITFLIGNGFDINIGLDTRYEDFLACYLRDNPKDTASIRQFKEDIRSREKEDAEQLRDNKLWSNAELAFGEYTETVAEHQGTAAVFCERHGDFCRKLATYLQEQEARVNTSGSEQKFIDALQEFRTGLSVVQREQVDNSLKAFGGGFNFNFIVYNYTEVIDKLVKAIRAGKGKFKSRSVGSSNFTNTVGEVVHVHGTTRQEMILGVNDISQIKAPKLFEGVSPAYIHSLIKPQTNQKNESRVDEKTHGLLKKSDLLYIYGMSLGTTDTIWWQRIIQAMKAKREIHVFIYAYGAPHDPLIQTEKWIYEEELKSAFLAFSEEETAGLEERIHIVTHDIFASLSKIATPRNEENEEMDEPPENLKLSS